MSLAAAILRILLSNPAALSSGEDETALAHLMHDNLPSDEHFSALAGAAAEGMHRALRRRSLLLALQAATPAVLEECAGGPRALFHLIAGLSPPKAFDDHISALVDAIADQAYPAAFLSDIFGSQGAASDVQVCCCNAL